MEVSDIELGCLGLEKEGWFDPWSLLYLLRSNAQKLGARYLEAEVEGFTFSKRLDFVVQGVEEGTYEALDELIVSKI